MLASTLLKPESPILVVDDQAIVTDLVTRIVRNIGYCDVDRAGDGASALLMMAQKTYRLVISDWCMEPVTGLDLVRAMRADPRLEETRFLMMTARMGVEVARQARAAGIGTFILKPFTPQMLQAKIAELI